MCLYHLTTYTEMSQEYAFSGNVKTCLDLCLVFNGQYGGVRSGYAVAHTSGQILTSGIKDTDGIKISQELVIHFICGIGPEHPAGMDLSGVIHCKLLLVLHFPYPCKQMFFPVGHDNIRPQPHILSSFRIDVSGDSCAGFCYFKRFYTCGYDPESFFRVFFCIRFFSSDHVLFKAESLSNSCFLSSCNNSAVSFL